MNVTPEEIRKAFPADELGRERFWSSVEIRDVDETASGAPRLAGVAAVFDERAKVKLPDGRVVSEQVAPTAFDKSMKRSDIFLLWQHDMSMPLARTGAGNLVLQLTKRGLEYDATLPNTQTARDALELVRSSVVDKMSFGFVLPPSGGDKITVEPDGTFLRTLTNIGLRELSLVSAPAYQSTSASIRSEAFALLCRTLGVDEESILDRLSSDELLDLDMLGVSIASQRSEPSLVETSVIAQGLVETPAVGIPTSLRLAALKLTEHGARVGLPRIDIHGAAPGQSAC